MVIQDIFVMYTPVSANPHLRQVTSPSQEVKVMCLDKLRRTLDRNAPKLSYRRRRGEPKSLSHWGQKKLLLSEIEFLTLYVTATALPEHPPRAYSYTCVYAGASPGEHIPFLCYLFPQVHFVLVDPRPFCPRLRSSSCPQNVSLRQELMTSDIVTEFTTALNSSDSSSVLLFISDIRSADWQALNSHAAMDEEVARDMTLQQAWHLALQPTASMLKFRLPWSAGCSQYLGGTVRLPVYGPLGTSETRLVVERGQQMEEFDHQEYWEQMFYFNTVTRYEPQWSQLLLNHRFNCVFGLCLFVQTCRICQWHNRFHEYTRPLLRLLGRGGDPKRLLAEVFLDLVT